jgi:hypothetical protein
MGSDKSWKAIERSGLVIGTLCAVLTAYFTVGLYYGWNAQTASPQPAAPAMIAPWWLYALGIIGLALLLTSWVMMFLRRRRAKIDGTQKAQIDVPALELLREQQAALVSDVQRISADIVRLNEAGVAQHHVSESFRVIIRDLQGLKRSFGYLIGAIHARDLEAQVKQADAVVLPLGQKLIHAVEYTDSKKWMADYREWHTNLALIDQAVANVGVEGHTAFLDIRRRDLEMCPMMPPESLRIDNGVIVPYKTVCLAQQRYMEMRPDVFRYFSVKGALPPG